jgi:hypothetical protein
MKRKERYAHFEPVTVRAAARVIHLAEGGRVSRWDATYYVQQLAAIDALATHAGAVPALRRLARWRSAFGRTGAPSTVRSQRSSRPRRARLAPCKDAAPRGA